MTANGRVWLKKAWTDFSVLYAKQSPLNLQRAISPCFQWFTDDAWNMKQTDVDVLIIGAGPAGSSAAALLHKQGFRLLVVEKQTFPRFVIGESLLPHSMDLLRDAGLLEAVEARQFMHKHGAVFLRGPRRATSISPTSSPPAGNTPIKFRAQTSTRHWPTPWQRGEWRFFTITV